MQGFTFTFKYTLSRGHTPLKMSLRSILLNLANYGYIPETMKEENYSKELIKI